MANNGRELFRGRLKKVKGSNDTMFQSTNQACEVEFRHGNMNETVTVFDSGAATQPFINTNDLDALKKRQQMYTQAISKS